MTVHIDQRRSLAPHVSPDQIVKVGSVIHVDMAGDPGTCPDISDPRLPARTFNFCPSYLLGAGKGPRFIALGIDIDRIINFQTPGSGSRIFAHPHDLIVGFIGI